MNAIVLRHPKALPRSEIDAYHQAFIRRGLALHGSAREGFADVRAWLEFVDAPAGTRHPHGWTKVADGSFAAWREADARMVGIINIRYELNDFLRNIGGHIGYSVHPDEWGRGYATQMLKLALQHCAARGLPEVLITCAADNGASRAVIVKNGGVRIDTIDADGRQVERYRVVTEKL